MCKQNLSGFLSNKTIQNGMKTKSTGEEVLRMAKVVGSSSTKRKERPAITPEARESQMIALAVDLAEKQLRDGSASSQVITHFLKLGTTRAELEKEKVKAEIEEKKAKVKAIEMGEEMKVLYENAINAMRNYAGYGDEDEY